MSNITIRKKLPLPTLLDKWFSIIACLNDINLTNRELELIGWIALNGFPKTREQKELYFQQYKRSEPTLYNLVRDIKKKGFLIKKDDNILLHPALKLNTEEPLNLNIIIEHE